MDDALLDIICCPITRQPLERLDSTRLDRLNGAIRAGAVRNHAEQALAAELREALVTRDKRLVYPVRDSIPILLEEEAIDWARLPE